MGDWWDASEVYRNWLMSAEEPPVWLANGPIENRSDVPEWLLNMYVAYPLTVRMLTMCFVCLSRRTVWVNSGWQELDIFNETQGDPDVVVERMTNIVPRFDIPNIGLHW